MGKKVIGIDYGTLSARAVIVDVENGDLCGRSTYGNPHGVIKDNLPENYALAHPQDYKNALINIIRDAMKVGGLIAKDIIGIGVDATTYTLVPCDKYGNVMCEHEEYSEEPMAFIKL